MSKKPPRKDHRRAATRTVRAGLESDTQFGAVVPPIYLTSNFAFEGYRRQRSKYDYTRSGNPTRDQLAETLADLEGGAGAVVTCTGLAAVTLLMMTLPAGSRVLAPHDCYGGTFRLLAKLNSQRQLVVDFVDQSDPAALQTALAAKPKLVWIETPSNPLLRIVDIRALATAAHAAGALVAADNTFLSPVWQQPLALGADYVMHSTTKYLNGHSDVVGGAVVAATPELHEQLAWWANAIGVTGAPFDSFMTLRGLRTLNARNAHARGEYRGGRRRPVPAPGRHARLLSGPRRSSGPRTRRAPTVGVRRNVELRTRGRRSRSRGVSRRPHVLPRWPSHSAASRASSRIRSR